MPPPPNEPRYQKTLEQIVDEVGVYSVNRGREGTKQHNEGDCKTKIPEFQVD